MEVKIKEILRNAYIEYGDAVFGDSCRLNAYIADLLVDYPTEQKRLTIIVKENIVSKVVAEKNFEASKFYFYSEMMSDIYGMKKEIAHEMLGYIFYALTGEEYEMRPGSRIDEEIEGIISLRKIFGFTDEDAYDYYTKDFSADLNPIDSDYLMVAYMYHCGCGIEKNIRIAMKLYENIITNHYKGGVLSDCQKLIIPWAKNNLGLILKEKNIKYAITLFEEAINSGVAIAAYNLAKIYREEALKSEKFEMKISLLKSADEVLHNALMNKMTTVDGEEKEALKCDYNKCAELAYKNSLNLYSAKSIEAFALLKNLYGNHILLQNVIEEKYFIIDDYLPQTESISITQWDRQLEICKACCEEYKQKSILYTKLVIR